MTMRDAGGAELTLLHRRADRGIGCRAVRRDDDTLAGGEPIGLDHHRKSELAVRDDRARVRGIVADAIARGRNAVARHELFGEHLAAFELRGRARRTEDR